MRSSRRALRWGAVIALVAVLASLPEALGAGWLRPAGGTRVPADRLLARIQASRDVAYSGYAEARGGLVLPVSTDLGSIADLFGGQTDLRAWYRAPDAWRVDSVSAFGESDLYGDATGTWAWNYEADQAVRVQLDRPLRARLPRPSDLLPTDLATRLLSEARPGEVHPIAATRVAGRVVPGLELRPADVRSTITRVDVWAVAATGLPVAVAVYGTGGSPVVSSRFLDLDTGTPSAGTTTFRPPAGAKVQVQDAPDLAATIDRFGRRRPPASLGGLDENSAAPDLGAIGIYGRGVTFLAAVPLPGGTADQLRTQLAKAAGSSQDATGVHLTVGPLSALLTAQSLTGRPWLLVGAVTAATLSAAAQDLPPGGGFR